MENSTKAFWFDALESVLKACNATCFVTAYEITPHFLFSHVPKLQHVVLTNHSTVLC